MLVNTRHTSTVVVKLPLSLTVPIAAVVGDAQIYLTAPRSLVLLPNQAPFVVGGSTVQVQVTRPTVIGTTPVLVDCSFLSNAIAAGSNTLDYVTDPVSGRRSRQEVEYSLKVSAELRDGLIPIDLPGINPQARLYSGRAIIRSDADKVIAGLVTGSETYECSLFGTLHDKPMDGYLYTLPRSANRLNAYTRSLGQSIEGIWQTVAFDGM